VDDIEAIKQLKARYFRTMDTKDWDAMREVFTDDVVMDTTASGGNVITGAEQCIAFLREAIGDVVTVHHGHTPEIELKSPTTAVGIWAMEDMLRWPGGRGLHRPVPRPHAGRVRGGAEASPYPFALLHPLCGGMPIELAWSSLRLFEHEVLPAFR
jgi:hypothetical protein